MADLPTNPLKLWIFPGACSLVPHILLEECGLSYEASTVAIGKDGISEEYRSVNPKMRVPALVMGDEVITELPAIVTAISYLAHKYHFLGRNTMETVRSYEWLNWLSSQVHGQAWGSLVRPGRWSDDETAHAGIRAKSLQKLEAGFAEIDERLFSTHAVGDAFTAPDAYLYVLYRWGAWHGIDMRRKYPKFTALAEAVSQRPAVQMAIEAEKVALLGFRE